MRTLAVALLASTLAGACAAPPRVAAPGRVAHAVYFWLRDDAPPGTADAIIDFYRTEVPNARGVESVLVGPPRASDRDVVDDGFAVAAITVFGSAADEVAWQTDPIHDVLRARFMEAIERVLVYDTLAAGAR